MNGVCCSGYRAWEAYLQLGQVFTPHVVAGMRAGTDVHNRVLAHLLQLRVIPSTAQIVPSVIMGSIGRPLRADLTRFRLGEVDGDLLPVRFVIVGAIEFRAPVVERIEKPVLQNYPAILAEHPTVVAVLLTFGHDALVEDRRRGRRLPRDPAPSQKSNRIEGIRNARQVPYTRQSARSGAKDVLESFDVSGCAPSA